MNVCIKYKKYYTMIELTFLKELMLLKQVHQKSVMFPTIGTFQIIVFSFSQMSTIDGMIY